MGAGLLGVVCAWALAGVAVNEDHGVYGETWEIVEPDLLEWIAERLARMEADGRIDAFNEQAAERAEARVRRPPAVRGILHAEESESWLYEPTIIVEEDIVNHEGVAFAHAGQEVNPLDTITLTRSYVFIDGDDEDQVRFGLERYRNREGLVSLILVNGEPLDLMERHQRRFFFDQEGVLTNRFGITAVPASIEQEGRLVRVRQYGRAEWRVIDGGMP